MSNTYTFEELAAAAASSNSIGEAVRKLGREPTSSRKRYVSELMRAKGIDCGHFPVASQLYSREMLEEAAAASRSISEVVRRLGAKEVGGTQAHIGRRLRHYEIDISHFDVFSRKEPTKSDRRPKEVPQSEFADAIPRARSIAEVARILGVANTNAFRRRYRYVVMALGLDVSHMLGQAHARGTRGTRRANPTDLLIADPANGRRLTTRRLRAALIEIGTPYRCAMCATGPAWQGHEITLEIDHISGDITDNRPENLRFLCPNCHATTPTFCRKKHSAGDALDG